MQSDNLLNINNVLVNKEIKDVKFACDLSRCKGACCTMESPYGAPLLIKEVETIGNLMPIITDYLPKEHIEEIGRDGFFEEINGILMTRSLNDRACVFVYYETGGIAKCAIEKACKDGKINFLKPVSCHLFPIRISKFGGDVLIYEEINECQSAILNGFEQNVTIAQFCMNSLVRQYGDQWYNKLIEDTK
ncbi:MAG: DUF3109 family protein [Ignavibacteria bacterium]